MGTSECVGRGPVMAGEDEVRLGSRYAEVGIEEPGPRLEESKLGLNGKSVSTKTTSWEI